MSLNADRRLIASLSYGGVENKLSANQTDPLPGPG